MVDSKIIVGGLAGVILVAAGGMLYQHNQLEATANELAAANAQMQQSNAQMREQVAYESMRELPVAMGFRSALLGPGKVVRVQNLAGTDIAVHAHVVDAAAHQVRDFTWNVDRGRAVEFGHTEGYAFEPGDQITLAHDGYKSKTWIVP